jgi:choline kinase
VEVGGAPILHTLLQQIRAADPGSDVVIAVSGDELLSAIASWGLARITTVPVDSPGTGDVVSLAATIPWWRAAGMALIDADLVVSTSLLRTAMTMAGTRTAVVVDPHRSPDGMDMRAQIRDGRLVRLDKLLPGERAHAEFTGISACARSDASAFAALVGAMATSSAEGEKSYEEAWTRLAGTRDVAAVCVPRPCMWIDIDTPRDLEVARCHADRIRVDRPG